MASTQHYLWASGHCILLLCSLRYLLAYVTFNKPPVFWYRTSFFGALISYTIVCRKALGTPVLNATFLHRALADENVQYFLLAVFWWYTKPIPIALFPYVVFSLFHVLTFVRTTVLPKWFPPSTPARTSGGSPPPQSGLAKVIHDWVKSNYDTAMRVTAFAEIAILLRVVLGGLTLQNSFLAPVIYFKFLQQRYYHSSFTRAAFAEVTRLIDKYADDPRLPPVVKQVWLQFKQIVRSSVGNVITRQ